MIDIFWFAFFILGSTAIASLYGGIGMMQFIFLIASIALILRALKLHRYHVKSH